MHLYEMSVMVQTCSNISIVTSLLDPLILAPKLTCVSIRFVTLGYFIMRSILILLPTTIPVFGSLEPASALFNTNDLPGRCQFALDELRGNYLKIHDRAIEEKKQDHIKGLEIIYFWGTNYAEQVRSQYRDYPDKATCLENSCRIYFYRIERIMQ